MLPKKSSMKRPGGSAEKCSKRRNAIFWSNYRARLIALQETRHLNNRDKAERIESGHIIGFQQRRLGRTILRTYRAQKDIDDLVPNHQQPRMGPKEDAELQRQIEANEGLFEPLLVEPHPQ